MDEHACRACRGTAGHLVLDLGEQPACDYFPRQDDPGPDPVYPLQMWLCSSCGLAQLLADPTVPEEPRGTEPAALVAQAADAVERVAAAGLLPARGVVAEYGSPHGGSWLELARRPRTGAGADGEQADVILDCFGMMHAADQPAALAERAARVAPGGVLLLQYHSLSTISAAGSGTRCGTATTPTTRPRADRDARRGRLRPAHRLAVRPVRRHRAAGREPGRRRRRPGRTTSVESLLAEEARTGVRDPDVFAGLQHDVRAHARRLHDWLAAQRAAGTRGPGLWRRIPGRRAAVPGATSTATCCPRSSTRPPPSRACGCPAPTSRSSPRRSWPRAADAVLLSYRT